MAEYGDTMRVWTYTMFFDAMNEHTERALVLNEAAQI